VFSQENHGGYVRLYSSDLSLGCYECDHLLDTFWAYDTTYDNWIESGILVGTICLYRPDHDPCSSQNLSAPYRVPRYYWSDQRYNDGYNTHVDVNANDYPPKAPSVLNTYHNDYIEYSNSTTWTVQDGPYSGTSNSNPLKPNELQTGTESTTQGTAYACNGQTGLQWLDTSGGWHNDWSGAQPYSDNPPFVDNYSAGKWHDWAGFTKTECYGNASPVAGGSALQGNDYSSSQLSSTPMSESQIKTIALAYAAGFGDPNPTSIEHVESPRNQAVLLASDDSVPDQSDSILIAEQGSFIGANAPRPPGAPAPTGSVLTLVIDRYTGQLSDFGLRDSVPNLASRGQVTVDQ
jgi:hypothetical protein